MAVDGGGNPGRGGLREALIGRFFLVGRPLLLTALLLLAACGAPGTPSGTLTGTVVAAPCRPVERVGDPPCPPVPGVTVTVGSTHTITDAAGVYRVTLPPGTYRVTVTAGVRQVPAEPASVTVVAGRATTVNLTYDSGIR